MKNRASLWIAAGLVLAWLLVKNKPAAAVATIDPKFQLPPQLPLRYINGSLHSSTDGVHWFPVETATAGNGPADQITLD